MSVSVYVHPRMKYTIFQKERTRDVLKCFGVEFVDAPEAANVLVGNHGGLIREFVDTFGDAKRYLLWTHEPMFWTSPEKWAVIAGQRVRTISLHSGEVFFDNYYYASINPGEVNRRTQRTQLNRRVVMVASAKMQDDPAGFGLASGVDLLTLRYNLAMAGYRKKQLDIYGMNWPAGVSRGQSRYGQWSLAKYKILEKYDFNLCFENSLVPYYCSEKIWHAIHCGCLPIYFGQDAVYEDFPPESFLDYAVLGSADALFEAVEQMSVREFRERYDRCLQVFEQAFPLGHVSQDQAARYAALQLIALNMERCHQPAVLQWSYPQF
jgi:hypothetical protein